MTTPHDLPVKTKHLSVAVTTLYFQLDPGVSPKTDVAAFKTALDMCGTAHTNPGTPVATAGKTGRVSVTFDDATGEYTVGETK